MARKEMDAILAAEEAARARIEGARERASAIVAAAEKEAARALEDALAESRNEAKAILERASRESARTEEQALAEGRSEADRIKAMLPGKLDEAVKVILDRVKQSI